VLFTCIYVPNFVAQAAVRLDSTAAASPFSVVAGDPPQVRVALDAKAVKRGLWIGMTRTEAEASTGIRIFERSSKLEASAHAALLDCASRFSPRCEDVSDETLVLDIGGLSKLLERRHRSPKESGSRLGVQPQELGSKEVEMQIIGVDSLGSAKASPERYPVISEHYGGN
jgi:hypothetical protein